MNTEHQLKSKLTRPACPKSMKLKRNGTGAMTTAKNAVFIVIIRKLLFSGGSWLLVEGGRVYGGGIFLGGGEQIYSSPVGKALTTR